MNTHSYSGVVLAQQPSSAIHLYPKNQKRQMLAERLRHILKVKQLSGTQFAELMNKKPAEISKWLSGRHNFTTDTIFEIEEKLGFSLINVSPPQTNVVKGIRAFGIKANSTSLNLEIGDILKHLNNYPRYHSSKKVFLSDGVLTSTN